MQITPKILTEIASHEGVVREAYKDSTGVWTWGVGITSASGHDVERYIGNPQPMEKVFAVFQQVLETYADDVRKAFEGYDLTEAQFGAALSFHWNTGGIFKATWVKHFKEGNIAKAKAAFMNWRRPAEIIPRRREERDLFFDGTWASGGKFVEYSKLRPDYTPDYRHFKIHWLATLAPATEPRKEAKGFWATLLNDIITFLSKGAAK